MKSLIFTYLMTYGGAAVSLFNPFYGLLAYVCFAIIRPESLWFFSVPQGGNYSRIIAIAMLTGWALHGFGSWDFGRGRAIVVMLLAYLGWSIIGALTAPDLGVGIHFVEELCKIVLPFLVGMTTIRTSKQLQIFAWTIVLSQGYVAYEMNMSYFSGYNRLQDAGFGGMDNNSYVISVVTCLGAAFFLGLSSRKLPAKLLAFACAAFMAHAVLFSYSRGGMVSMIAVGLACFVTLPKKPAHVALFIVGLAVGLRMAGPSVLERFQTVFAEEEERDASAQSRLDLWRDCVKEFQENPILGCGPNHWVLIGHKYGWGGGKEAHSLWFQQLAEQGFIGVGILFLFYGIGLKRLWPYARAKADPADPWLSDAARMVVASLMGFFVSSQFVSLEGLETPYYVSMMGAALLMLESRRERARAYSPSFQSQPYASAVPRHAYGTGVASPWPG